jgi:hypothetical protein
MNKLLFLLLVYLVNSVGFGQKINKAKLELAIQQAIPKDFALLDSATGNLNLDKYPDLIIILKERREDTIRNWQDTIKRPLLIFIGDSTGNFNFLSKNSNTVLCNFMGGAIGDPYERVVINKGFFTIEHYGGSSDRWKFNVTYKFNKTKNKFYLHREDIINFSTHNPDKILVTTKTIKNFGLIAFERHNILNE